MQPMTARKLATLPKAILEHVALVQLRALVGNNQISDVIVEQTSTSIAKPNWKIAGIRNARGHVYTRKNVPPHVLPGILCTQELLSQHYNLRSD
jgi:hypothetical protein